MLIWNHGYKKVSSGETEVGPEAYHCCEWDWGWEWVQFEEGPLILLSVWGCRATSEDTAHTGRMDKVLLVIKKLQLVNPP